MVSSADDVGYLHFDVVHDSAQLIGGQGGGGLVCPRRTHEDEILDLVVANFARAKYGVVKAGRSSQRHEEADRWIFGRIGGSTLAATAARNAPFGLAFGAILGGG